MLKAILLLLAALALASAAPGSTGKARHGSERIVVEKKKDKDGNVDDGMQFKTFSGNESESMFESVKGDDLNITMQEANITTSGYVSDEVKDQQEYHHYNNTNFFVTFRVSQYRQKGETQSNIVKRLAYTMRDSLKKDHKFKKVKVKKLY